MELKHYGTPRHSGRYPWGSGKKGYQRAISWRGHVDDLKRKGYSDIQIAKMEGITTTQLRARNSLVKDEIRAENRARAIRMKEHGYSNMEIARRLSTPDKTWNESSVRALLDPVIAERANITRTTANMLKDEVDQKGYIDVGAGIENHIGVSRTKINTALAQLEDEGYKIHRVNVEQVGMPGQFTIMKALGTPDSEWKDLVKDPSQIKNINMISDDYGRTYKEGIIFDPKKVQSVSSDRIQVRYSEDGGKLKDGVIELRRGPQDLDMGKAQYAQVRIKVDDSHFLKGMAIYSDDMPAGTDIVFNTNKHDTGNKFDAMKKLKNDPDNPFGSSFKEGGQRGAINIVNEEGDWDSWSRTLSSQVLSKQTPTLAKRQLELGLQEKREEHLEIMSLTNPVVKKQLLLAFSDDCDASAADLKAAGLPRQASKVILPVPDIKENEIYAPTFKNGESVVLIRHPHGGIFEIPEVIVNNKSPSAQAIMKNAPDAIGIHPNVAQKLSGADFDGDTVIVIPNNKGAIKTSATLKSLENFDPIEAYPGYPGMPTIKPQTKQTKMGEVSNLITDMTIKGADFDEIAKAVKHSMVVIDSEKHNLNYKQSYIDNDIAALSEKYQNSKRGGASTIISKATSQYRVPQRKSGYSIDPNTGEKIYSYTESFYVDKKGKVINKTSISTYMAETKDAMTLSSGRQIENIYAGYANELKALANDSRKTALSIIPTKYNPSARKTYDAEVISLNDKLGVALRNKPLERQAQVIANSIVARKKQNAPHLDKDDLKKIKTQALNEGRSRTGAKKNMVVLTEREWEAIQAGAVSPSRLSLILQNANLDQIKQLATPRTTTAMSPAKIQRAKSMIQLGLTQAEVAESLGVSTATIQKAITQ